MHVCACVRARGGDDGLCPSRLQEVVELQSEIVAENEELKATVIRYQDQIKDFEHNINRKEKENIALATQLSECEAQVRAS